MKFWKKEYNYKIIDDTVSEKELQEFLRKNNIFLDIVDNSTAWAAFAQYYGRKNGFNPIHTASFAYMVSMFIGGMGINAGTDAYIKEETVEQELLNTYNEINKQDITEETNVLKTFDQFIIPPPNQYPSEETKVLGMFDAIVDLYTNRIHLFEYCSEWISFKVTPTERELFRKLPGKTAREKFHHLMNLPSE